MPRCSSKPTTQMALDLIAQIDGWGKTAPGKMAHVSQNRNLTYGELAVSSNNLATQLSRILPDDGSPIAVIGHKEPEMLIAFIAAVKSGHPYVPLDTSIPQQRAERIVVAAGARITLSPAVVAEMAATAANATAHCVGWNDPYYIIFTSGSTGEPKGVVITLECLTSFVQWMLGEHELKELDEVFLNQAPFSFDLSVMDLYLSLATGGTLFSITAEQIANPKRLYQALERSGVTSWVSTPSFAQLTLAEKTFDRGMLPCLGKFFFCGETLAPEVAAQLLDRFPEAEVWNTYGPTEATCATTSLRVDRTIIERYSPLPVGYAKPDAQILVVDEEDREVRVGDRGEIVIAGTNVSTGYLGRPDLNARAFFSLKGMRAYRTGDIGHWHDRMLFFDGRRDNQVKLHGYRVELGDIESNLRALPGIRDAVVIPAMKQGHPDSLAAFVILDDTRADSDFQLGLEFRGKLGERLPSYMIPRKFYFLNAFPMTANGKADRRKLEEMVG
jgi:D-alanine--poly(phosphoribitol) ligase subunit 1